MKINLETVIDAIQHSSNKQEEEFLHHLNQGTESWAGIVLGKMIDEHVESMEEEEELEPDFGNLSIDAIASDRAKGY